MVIGLAGVESDADDLVAESESVAISGRECRDEDLACAGDLVERGERIADHRGQVQTVGSAVEDVERLGEVGVQFHDRAELRRLALAEKQ